VTLAFIAPYKCSYLLTYLLTCTSDSEDAAVTAAAVDERQKELEETLRPSVGQ